MDDRDQPLDDILGQTAWIRGLARWLVTDVRLDGMTTSPAAMLPLTIARVASRFAKTRNRGFVIGLTARAYSAPLLLSLSERSHGGALASRTRADEAACYLALG